MKDYIEIETTPSDEQCVNVSHTEDYMPSMRSEAYRYKKMLEKRFPFINQLGLILRIKSNPHDFGTYLSIKIEFECDTPREDAAYFIENNLPEKWTDIEVLNPEFVG